MGWKTDRSLVHMNRGLETKILMKKMLMLTGKYRVEAWERKVGGLPSKIFEQVYWEKEANQMFIQLGEETLSIEYRVNEASSPVIVIEEEDDATNT